MAEQSLCKRKVGGSTPLSGLFVYADVVQRQNESMVRIKQEFDSPHRLGNIKIWLKVNFGKI